MMARSLPRSGESVETQNKSSVELKIVNGQIPLPRKPGLGIEVNRQALRKFGVNA
jgi:L-alanine-DL-glutamate epimerase-like enolase superfamily enzyme